MRLDAELALFAKSMEGTVRKYRYIVCAMRVSADGNIAIVGRACSFSNLAREESALDLLSVLI